MHRRVVHVFRAPYDVYVGRGPCPRRGHAGRSIYGNPFSVDVFGVEAMVLFLRWCAGERFTVTKPVVHVPGFESGPLVLEHARRDLVGSVLGCWCAPKTCHGDVWARAADGEDLASITADVLEQLALQQELFGG